MYYGKDKTRQMVRSILPSTARKAVRDDKRALQHKNRAELNTKLANYKGYADDVIEYYEDDAEDLDHCWTPRFMPGYDTIVRDRRESDKLNHFVRWAEKITADIDPEERMDYMRALVPPGVIGNHALTHLRKLDPQRDREREWYHYVLDNKPGVAERLRRREYYKAICDDVNSQIYEAIEAMMATPKTLTKWNNVLANMNWLEREHHRRLIKRRQREQDPAPRYGGDPFEMWTTENYTKFKGGSKLTFTYSGHYYYSRTRMYHETAPAYNYGFWCKFVCHWFNIELPEQLKN